MHYVAITFDANGLITEAKSTSKGPMIQASGDGYQRRLSKTVFGGGVGKYAGATEGKGQSYLGPFTKESEADDIAATIHSAILAIDNARVIIKADNVRLASANIPATA